MFSSPQFNHCDEFDAEGVLMLLMVGAIIALSITALVLSKIEDQKQKPSAVNVSPAKADSSKLSSIEQWFIEGTNGTNQ